jgi:cation/acetate symporter
MVGLMGILALAACMSTISAVLNTAAVLIAKDWVGAANPKLSREILFKWARRITIIIGIFAIFIATLEIPQLVPISLVMYDCTVQAFPAIFIGLFWRRANLPGVSIGFAVGCLFSLLGNAFPATIAWAGGGGLGWSGGMIGVVFNVIIVVICGFACKPYERVDELFNTVKTYREVRTNKLI